MDREQMLLNSIEQTANSAAEIKRQLMQSDLKGADYFAVSSYVNAVLRDLGIMANVVDALVKGKMR